MKCWLLPLALALALGGCGAPSPPQNTGGVSVPSGRCGRGLVVVGSDYQSTNVSLVGLDGAVLSSSLVYSASTSSALSAPLSGDVVTPNTPVTGAEVVLIDRYPASVLSWIDLATAQVRAQLDVRTGFASNPQDYLELSSAKAYVSRYETNSTPGVEPFDGGGDVLVVDPTVPGIVDRIDLSAAVDQAAGFLARAGPMVVVDEHAYVLVAAYDATFGQSAPSRVVTIDTTTDEIAGVTVLEGLHGCGALALSGDRLAVACSGVFGGDANASIAESAVVVLTIEGSVPNELTRHTAADIAGQPIGFAIDFAAADNLLVSALGSFVGDGADVTDALFSVGLTDGSVQEVWRNQQRPFELGQVRCVAPTAMASETSSLGCGDCWLADAEASQLHLLQLGAGGIEVVDSLTVETAIGLPPRALGRF